MVRESEHIIGDYNGNSLVVSPTYPSGLMALEVTANSVNQIATINDSYLWQYIGISGIVSAQNKIFLVALSSSGLIQKTYTLNMPNGPVLPEGTATKTPTQPPTPPDTTTPTNPTPPPTTPPDTTTPTTPVPKSVLLSNRKPTLASSIENRRLTPDKAVDGSMSSRWGSLEGVDPQWISIDLGRVSTITSVSLTWDAYALEYAIQVSNDKVNWTTIYSTTKGRSGTENLSGLNGKGRYIRMYGTKRGTPWGYSLNEFKVYGYK